MRISIVHQALEKARIYANFDLKGFVLTVFGGLFARFSRQGRQEREERQVIVEANYSHFFLAEAQRARRTPSYCLMFFPGSKRYYLKNRVFYL